MKMPSPLLCPIYLNLDFIQDLSSILINGYFDSITIKQINDNTITGRYQNNNKSQHTNDYKNTSGDKDDSTTLGNSCYNYEDMLRYSEGRNFDRNDVTMKRAFSVFSYYNSLKNTMENFHLIRHINADYSCIENISFGDYVELTGSLEVTLLSNNIDNCILILNNYGTSSLDKLFDNKSIGPLTYTVILELLKSIQKSLYKGNTYDIFVNNPGLSCILTLNSTYTSKFSYIYDNASCNCSFLGKVTKAAYTSNDNISLLKKTGLNLYYTNLINSFKPYFQVLNDNGFSIPNEFITNITGPALEIIPISICI